MISQIPVMLILPDPNPHHLGYEAFSSRIALKCVLTFKSESDLKVNWKLVLMNLEVGFNELLCVSRFTFRTNSAREAAFRSRLRPSVRTEAVFRGRAQADYCPCGKGTVA